MSGDDRLLSTPYSERLVFLDNLRTFLIFLVVAVHAGMVYESSGLMGSFWIVDDPAVSKVPGLVNLMLDVFVMPTIFFIAGFFAPRSIERRGPARFLVERARRLLLPWAVAVLTLIPLYKMIFLASRGLPPEHWTTYFHFRSELVGMGWLWFLPVLFLFDVLYALLWQTRVPLDRIPIGPAVVGVFVLSLGYSTAVSLLGWSGWTKTLLVDFQNEKIVPYFLVFLLGIVGRHRRIFESPKRPLALYITVCATAWIPLNLYTIMLLRFLFAPGNYLVSPVVDVLLLWLGSYLSLFALLYCAVVTFQRFLGGSRPLGALVNPLAYGVYIVHVPVMGLIALALLPVGLPGLAKYPILVATTWVASHLVVLAHRRWLLRPLGLSPLASEAA